MAENSHISWTHHTFNPWRGCTKVSDGCKFCYADAMSKRNPGVLGVWGVQGSRVIASESYWRQPHKWNKTAEKAGERHRVFCASLADVFEGPETMPEEAWPLVQAARVRLWALIEETPHLDWLLLTKRPQNIARYMPARWGADMFVFTADNSPTMPSNVWVGTSVESQSVAEERISYLVQIPAKVRFLSCEPLLGPIDFTVTEHQGDEYGDGAIYWDMLSGYRWMKDGFEKELACERPIHWVIVGGESGTKARRMEAQWARSIRNQCELAGTAFFMKQMGSFVFSGKGEHDIPADLQIQEFPRGYGAQASDG